MADTNQIVVGHCEPDNGVFYLPIGFVPDFFLMTDAGASAPTLYLYWEEMLLAGTAACIEGVKFPTGSGANVGLTVDTGFAKYDTGSQGPTITRWSAGATVVAKTATAPGTYMKPSLDSDMDKDAVFEVLANTTTGATEPTWPAGIGETIADNHGSPVVYERVNVPTKRIGYQGIRIDDGVNADAEEIYYLAIQADKVIDHGDVDGWSGGVFGA